MPEKPTTSAGYDRDFVQKVRATCLYLATRLGDLADDLVVVGGLVPSLLVEQDHRTEELDRHVGTLDLDLGLGIGLLDEARYRTLTERLRRSGFSPDESESGAATRQRWKIEGAAKVTLDFLIQPSQPDDRGGQLRHIEGDFAAIIAPGLDLAFEDRRLVRLSGVTILGEDAERTCGFAGRARTSFSRRSPSSCAVRTRMRTTSSTPSVTSGMAWRTWLAVSGPCSVEGMRNVRSRSFGVTSPRRTRWGRGESPSSFFGDPTRRSRRTSLGT